MVIFGAMKEGEATGRRGMIGADEGAERKAVRDVTCCGERSRIFARLWIKKRAHTRFAVCFPIP